MSSALVDSIRRARVNLRIRRRDSFRRPRAPLTAMSRHIRPIALALIWRGQELLVFEGYDPADGGTFYRPLGGGIRFGERSDQALRRELREELGVELVDVRYLQTLENLFVHNGAPGHEIVQLYEATLADPSFYEREHFEVHEDGGLVLTARWMALNEFLGDGAPLVPEGLLPLLTREGGTS